MKTYRPGEIITHPQGFQLEVVENHKKNIKAKLVISEGKTDTNVLSYWKADLERMDK